jgi:acetylornithine deacetylase
LAADCCILGEPTAFQVTPWHFGTVWVAFRTRGTMAHTAFQDRAVNAIDKSMLVYNALKSWSEGYRDRNVFDGMKPNVIVSAMRGGWPWRVSRVPVFCDIFMDVRLSPEMTVVELKAELEGWLAELKREHPTLDCDVEFYGTGAGTQIDGKALVVESICAAHRQVFGGEPKIGGVNFYSDAAHMNRYQIPTVNYGLSGRLRTGGEGFDPAEGEHQSISDLVAGTKVYALAALDITSRQRD